VDSLDGVKAVLSELLGKSHEVALDEGDLLREASSSGVLLSSAELKRAVDDLLAYTEHTKG
jgi:hypothetical protein